MLRAYWIVSFLLAPASAALVNFFELLTYDIKSSMTPHVKSHLAYDTVSQYTALAVCDWSDGGVMLSGQGCGSLCRLINGISDMPSAVAYSPSDHMQMISLGVGDTPLRETAPSISGNMFMCFRGTYVWDVVNNRRTQQLALHPTSLCSSCSVHRGFWRNFVAVKSSVSRLFTDVSAKVTSPDLVIVGHSMGSAMARIAALYLRTMTDVKAVYALGAPRIFNKQSADLLSSVTAAITVNVILDPACHFPFRSFGYRHSAPIYAIYIEPLYWDMLSMGEDVDAYEEYMFYHLLDGVDADYKMATVSPYFSSSSHLNYFIGLDSEYLITCGGMADRFVFNTNALSLFD